MVADKWIPRKEGDRLLVSIAAALAVQVCIALALGFIDWEAASEVSQDYGPVEVSFQDSEQPVPEDSQEPEQLPEEELETPPEPESETEPEAETAEPSETEPPEEREPPEVKESSAETEPRQETARAREPAPQEEEAPSQWREAARQMRAADKDEEADPARIDPEAERKGEEVPKEGTGRSEVIYDDEPVETPETGEEAARGEEKKTEEAPSVFEDFGDEDFRSAPEDAQESEKSERDTPSGEATGDSEADVDYELEGIDEGEKPGLIYNPMPELSDEQLVDLPPEIEVLISFTLDPSGRLISLRMEKETPNSEVNTKIRQAVRTWRFEERDVAESVTGTLRIILRAK